MRIPCCPPLKGRQCFLITFSLAYAYLYGCAKKIRTLVVKSSSKLGFSLAYTYLSSKKTFFYRTGVKKHFFYVSLYS